MTGTPTTRGYQFKGSDPEVSHVWNIIESCETLAQTATARKCVDALVNTRKNTIPKEIIKEMREYIFEVSYDMFWEESFTNKKRKRKNN